MANQRRPDLINVSTHIDRETERAFDAWARTRGGKAAALRSLIRDAVGAPVPDRQTVNAYVSDLHVRLSEPEREALRQAAAQKGMAPSTWVRLCRRADRTGQDRLQRQPDRAGDERGGAQRRVRSRAGE